MKTILLIEDNANILENFTEYLELEGYAVLAAKNGKIGMELAQKFLPDLIICDVLMPEMDGRNVLSLIKGTSQISEIPFIFSSSVSEKFDKTTALKLGADDYMLKPFSLEVLLKSAQRCMQSSSQKHKSALQRFWLKPSGCC